jgi:hypothetical protein
MWHVFLAVCFQRRKDTGERNRAVHSATSLFFCLFVWFFPFFHFLACCSSITYDCAARPGNRRGTCPAHTAPSVHQSWNHKGEMSARLIAQVNWSRHNLRQEMCVYHAAPSGTQKGKSLDKFVKGDVALRIPHAVRDGSARCLDPIQVRRLVRHPKDLVPVCTACRVCVCVCVCV